MRKNKSMIILSLVAIMLIGFTACQQPAYTYKDVMGLEATVSKTSYIKGEYFDQNTVSGTVTFTDGSKQSVSGSDVVVTIPNNTTGKLNTAGNVNMMISYGAATCPVTVTVLDVKGITLDNLPETGSWVNGDDTSTNSVDVDTDEVTATITLSDGSTRELESGEFALVLKIDEGSTKGAALTDADVSVSSVTIFGNSFTVGSSFTVSGVDNWVIDVPAGRPAYNGTPVELGFEYYYTSVGDFDSNYKNDGKDSTFYAGDTVTWTAYLVDEDGGREEVAPSQLIIGSTSNNTLNQTIELGKDTEKTYTVFYKGDMDVQGELEIVSGDNWVKAVTATVKTDDDNHPVIAPEQTGIDYNDFEYKVTLAYGTTETETGVWNAATAVDVINSTAPKTGTYQARLEVAMGKGDVPVVILSNTITPYSAS